MLTTLKGISPRIGDARRVLPPNHNATKRKKDDLRSILVIEKVRIHLKHFSIVLKIGHDEAGV